MRPHATVVAAARPPAGAAALVGAAVVHGALPPGSHPWWVGAVVGLGIAAIWAGLRRNGLHRAAGWRRFALGVTWYGASDVLWLAVAGLRGAEDPLASAVWLAGVPGIAVAVGGLRRVFASGRRDVDREATVDALLIAMAVGFAGWQLLVAPAAARSGWSSSVVLLSTPLLLGTATSLALALGRGLRGGSGTPSLWLLAAAIPLTAATSLVYWTTEAGHAWASAPVARPLQALSYAAAAAATWHPTARDPVGTGPAADGPVWTRLALVGAGAAVVPLWHGAAAVVVLPRPDLVGGLLGIGIVVLAIGRIGLTLRRLDGAEQALRGREARFRSLVEHAFDSIAIVDADLRVTWASTASGTGTGRSLGTALGTSLLDGVHPDDREGVRGVFRRCAATPGASATGAVRAVTAGGQQRWVEFSVTNRLHDPPVAGLVVNHRDVTDTVAARAALEHQAAHDPLTGLPNRTTLARRLEASVARGDRPAVMLVDLDRFKVVNDSLGHPEGDRLLVAVAERLTAVVGEAGLVTRLGGDEFVVLVEGAPTQVELLALAGEICAAAATPVALGGHEVATGASVGIAVHDGRSSTADLLRDADTAMYRVKGEGRDGFALFDPAWRQTSAARLRIETALRRALAEGRGLELHHQPILSVTTGAVTGVEALLRWQPEVLGLEPSDTDAGVAALIGVAEDSGLIGALGDWVVRQACRDLAALDAELGGPGLSIAVNVSGAQLRRDGFAAAVRQALADSGVSPDRLVVELTESVVLDDIPGAEGALSALRADGVRLAMDDFGTGYSALSNLKRFPFSQVKIDRSFVADLGRDAEDTALVTAVVGMAHALGLSVVAEGVETIDQLAVLEQLGCDEVQGYLIGRPMPCHALGGWLRAHAATTGERGEVEAAAI
jgi:diguanylate cyclase (GGDEF)-like protein/PAS domain S-box-containing protein